jgi:hypothetical protein
VISAAPQAFAETLPVEIPESLVLRTGWVDVNALPALLLGGRRRTSAEGFFTDRPGLSMLGKAYRALVNFPDGAVGWLPAALRAGHRLLEGWRPDFIYASALPFSALVVARRLAQRHRLQWFAELRDLWTEHQYNPAPFLRGPLDRRLETSTLRAASGIVTVSEPLAQRLRRFGPPVEIVMNGYEPRDYPDVTRPAGGPLRIIYTGMIYPGFSDPRPLFAALAQVRQRMEVRVEFYGRSHRAPLMSAAREHGVEDLVSISSPVPHREALALQRGADALLLLLWSDRSQTGIYTGKLFEYLGARRPILAVGPGEDVAGALLRERGAGFVGEAPEAIARWLLDRWSEKQQRGDIADLPESAAAGFSRSEQFAKLDRFIERCLVREPRSVTAVN